MHFWLTLQHYKSSTTVAEYYSVWVKSLNAASPTVRTTKQVIKMHIIRSLPMSDWHRIGCYSRLKYRYSIASESSSGEHYRWRTISKWSLDQIASGEYDSTGGKRWQIFRENTVGSSSKKITRKWHKAAHKPNDWLEIVTEIYVVEQLTSKIRIKVVELTANIFWQHKDFTLMLM